MFFVKDNGMLLSGSFQSRSHSLKKKTNQRSKILTALRESMKLLTAAHGNSLRAGIPSVYEFDERLHVVDSHCLNRFRR